MCGVPYHAAEAYISRLIAKGYKVAICEQMEDPAAAKGLVERDIIRIVTPGTVIEETMLEEGKNNFLCALCLDGGSAGLCFADLSTGEVSATGFDGPAWREHVENELGRFSPREVLLSPEAYGDEALKRFLSSRLDCRAEAGAPEGFQPGHAGERVRAQFGASADTLPAGPVTQAAGALMDYLYETQKTDLSHLSEINYYTTGEFMELDLTARRNLELTETLRGGEKKGSLLWVLDKTCTAMGHRLIRSWLERPLLSPVQIGKRQGAVADLAADMVSRQELERELREVTDLERLIGRVVYGTAGGRDMVALSRALESCLSCGCCCLPSPPPFWRYCGRIWTTLPIYGGPSTPPLWRNRPSPSGRAALSGRAITRRWTGCGASSPAEGTWWPPWRPRRRRKPVSKP